VNAPRYSDAEVEELLGAYALDACEPDENDSIEVVLARRPDLADEAARLTQVAAWIGAAQALRAPEHLRDTTLARAESRRAASADPAVDLYLTVSDAFEATLDALPPAALDQVTTNGLTGRELVVHVAAQESLLAQLAGAPTLDAVQETDIEARTAAVIAEFRHRGLDDVVDQWRTAVEANRRWGLGTESATTQWRGLQLSSHDALVVRAFETWVHDEDLRLVAELPRRAPEARHLGLMTDLAGRSLGLSLALAGRERPGHTGRLVLTGDGGGEWLVEMGGATPSEIPDVTVTADAVDWCRLVGNRVAPHDLEVEIVGDRALADDLLASANALATL
jgi:uncharacterized protein (TIGR03083 family)